MSNQAKEDKQKKTQWEKKRASICIWLLHFLAIAILGIGLFPMIFFFYSVWQFMGQYPVWLKILTFSFSIALGYFIFGVTLIFTSVFVKNIFNFRVVPGLHRIHSKEALLWMAYNSMILLVNNAFLDVLRLSPFQTLFYRSMGAKVGNDVNINTGGLADLSLLEIGDNVMIGGGVALICHASERGFLRLAPTKIGNNVSIGIGTIILPDCQIGDGASISPCSLLPKGTRIPPKGVWGGNPLRDLRAERRSVLGKEPSESGP